MHEKVTGICIHVPEEIRVDGRTTRFLAASGIRLRRRVSGCGMRRLSKMERWYTSDRRNQLAGSSPSVRRMSSHSDALRRAGVIEYPDSIT